MKYIIKFILIITVMSFGGCYTILWSPQEQLPSKNTSQVFYSEPYYGEYNYYYDYPWWVTENPVYITPSPSQSQERNSTPASVRDNNGSRNNPDNNGSIIRTAIPSRSSPDNSSVSKTSTDNNSNNSGEQTRSSGNSRSNEGNNSARNNNGNRNSGNGRR